MRSRVGLHLLAAAVCVAMVGCGDGFDLAPVSGVVTIDGEPVEGVSLTYFPKGSDDNPNPGPFSTGVTDAQGKYTLTTRYGNDGAVVGDHRVEIEAGGGEDGVTDEDIGEAKSAFDEAMATGDKESLPAAKRQYESLLKRRAAAAKIPQKFRDGATIAVTVPSGGTSEANIDLATD